LLLVAMAALLSYCGWIIAAWDGIVWSLVGGAMMLVLVRRVPPGLVLQAIGARPVARWEEPMLYEILDELCRQAGLYRVPHLCWVGDRFPVAFTIGGGEATHDCVVGGAGAGNDCPRDPRDPRARDRPCAQW
jgi:Zn-dependent protease with chaperone function